MNLDITSKKENIITDYYSGSSFNKICVKYKISDYTLKRLFKEWGVALRIKKSRNKFSDKHDIIVELFNQNKSCKQIAKILNVHFSPLTSYCKRIGLDVSRFSNNRFDKIKNHTEDIIKLYNSGKSTIEIGRLYKCSASSIVVLLNNNKITLRPARKYSFREDYFENIDTPNKAYILGFTYADGNVVQNHKIQQYVFRIGICDLDLLEDIKNELQYTGPLYYRPKRTEKHKDLYTLQIISKKMVEDLIKLDCVPNKTFKIKCMPNISRDLIPHFIRGYFDGDGTIQTNGICGIIGNEPFLLDVVKFLNIEYRLHSKTFNRNHPTKIMAFSKLSSAKVFGEIIYKDCDKSLFLKRKRQRYLNKFHLAG
jgi:intein-encoded DNA endonuclease-like protein